MVARISHAEWASMTDRLTLKAVRLVQTNKTWQGIPAGTPPGGMEAIDYVKTAITAYLELESDLGLSTPQDVYFWLSNHIKRLISNHSRSAENRITIPAITSDESDPSAEGEKFFGHNIVNLRDHSRNPEEELIRKREREFIREHLSDDHIVQKIALMMIDYRISKPQQLADYLGLPIKSVYNAKRKLIDKLKKLRQQSEENGGAETGDAS